MLQKVLNTLQVKLVRVDARSSSAGDALDGGAAQGRAQPQAAAKAKGGRPPIAHRAPGNSQDSVPRTACGATAVRPSPKLRARQVKKTYYGTIIQLAERTRFLPTLLLFDAIWRVVFYSMEHSWREVTRS